MKQQKCPDWYCEHEKSQMTISVESWEMRDGMRGFKQLSSSVIQEGTVRDSLRIMKYDASYFSNFSIKDQNQESNVLH